MKVPLILVNFKSYKEAAGERAVRLAKICEKVSKNHGITIAVAPQFIDLQEVKTNVKIPVFAQHIDPIERAGAFTGHIIAENLKAVGINGTLISHSERKLPLRDIKRCVEVAKKLGMISDCCAATPREGEKIARFAPDFIAVEPPELIGSGIPVSKAKPEVVTKSVERIGKVNSEIKVLCGAGITTGEDVRRALELGTEGILVASGVVKAGSPEKVLEEFVLATKSFTKLRLDMYKM